MKRQLNLILLKISYTFILGNRYSITNIWGILPSFLNLGTVLNLFHKFVRRASSTYFSIEVYLTLVSKYIFIGY